jgi:hypothetical protein
MNSIEWLQQWYLAQCNDNWEHYHGVKFETLDNPGWRITIDLKGTTLDQIPDQWLEIGDINHWGVTGNHDWIDCRIEDGKFTGAGGPDCLIKLCDVFRLWAESYLNTATQPE